MDGYFIANGDQNCEGKRKLARIKNLIAVSSN